MKTLHGFNFTLWMVGAVIGFVYAHNLGFTMYELSGAALAAVMWWLEPS